MPMGFAGPRPVRQARLDEAGEGGFDRKKKQTEKSICFRQLEGKTRLWGSLCTPFMQPRARVVALRASVTSARLGCR